LFALICFDAALKNPAKNQALAEVLPEKRCFLIKIQADFQAPPGFSPGKCRFE